MRVKVFTIMIINIEVSAKYYFVMWVWLIFVMSFFLEKKKEITYEYFHNYVS